ncbi:MAG: YqiA/YcfP family alpha/beta fold hydrolase [Aggregatilineales bacterium]
MTKTVIYLHGFASSPGSKKANFFKSHVEATGATYLIPDLNQPDFQHLTLTAMLEKTAQTVNSCEDGDVYLVGSSMGGLTATHLLDRYKDNAAGRIKKAILLAPAFDFMSNRNHSMGADWQQKWRDAGSMPFFNYAVDGEVPVHYGLVEDVSQYDSYDANIDIPIQIFHGTNDESVDYQQSVRFAENRENVTLNLLDSDHQLLDKTDLILQTMLDFFDLSSN